MGFIDMAFDTRTLAAASSSEQLPIANESTDEEIAAFLTAPQFGFAASRQMVPVLA